MTLGNKLLSQETVASWARWIELTRSRCHLHFQLEGGEIKTHIEVCRRSAANTIERIRKDLPNDFYPKRILEIGASVGFNSLALATYYPDVEVHSIEPDAEAVDVAKAMALDFAPNYVPIVGIGEKLIYPNEYFDLIVCHTVIEHVQNVPQVIGELARVVSDRGFIHLEAPNYIWPYEPHLGVWCLPIFGKKNVRFCARVQGKRHDIWYIDHLQFVTPFWLQKLFNANGLLWENRAKKKLLDVVTGSADIKKYRLAARLLYLLSKLGLTKILVWMIIRSGLYSSVLYTLRKPFIDKIK